MADGISDRLEPTSRVPETPVQQPRRDGSRDSRRPPRPSRRKGPPDDVPEAPPHELDRLA